MSKFLGPVLAFISDLIVLILDNTVSAKKVDSCRTAMLFGA